MAEAMDQDVRLQNKIPKVIQQERLVFYADDKAKEEILEIFVLGVAKLKNKIYTLCKKIKWYPFIFVFDDQSPYPQEDNFDIQEMKFPSDIVASTRDNCFYINDCAGRNYIWRMIKDEDEIRGYGFTKWIEFKDRFLPFTLSITHDCTKFVVVSQFPTVCMKVYDVEKRECIETLKDLHETIEFPRHAVLMPNRNFLFLHSTQEVVKQKEPDEPQAQTSEHGANEDVEMKSVDDKEGQSEREVIYNREGKNDDEVGKDDEDNDSDDDDDEDEEEEEKRKNVEDNNTEPKKQTVWKITELSPDGKSVIRSLPISDDVDNLKYAIGDGYFCIYLYEKEGPLVFAADPDNRKVNLLDFGAETVANVFKNTDDMDKKVNKKLLRRPRKLFYDHEKKQLLIAEGSVQSGQGYVYTLE